MKKDLSDLLKPERSELIHNQKWFFVKIFEKTCFSVRFGSFRLRSMNTLNVQKSIKPLIFEYRYGKQSLITALFYLHNSFSW